jgi:hypothetical protein
VGLTGTDGWFPICEKMLPFELTLSVLLLAAKPGIPLPIKLQEQHRAFVPLDRPIDEAAGSALAAWSAGAKQSAKPDSASPPPKPDGRIDEKDAASMRDAIISAGVVVAFREKFGVHKAGDLPAWRAKEAWDWLKASGKQ